MLKQKRKEFIFFKFFIDKNFLIFTIYIPLHKYSIIKNTLLKKYNEPRYFSKLKIQNSN